MLEAYSSNITVDANQPVPFNSVALKKGCDVVQQGTSTFLFNKKGVYRVTLSASGAISGTTTGDILLQLAKNGVLQPQSETETSSTATTDVEAMSFDTFVQVPEDNSPCCAKTPTTIQILNNGVAALFTNIDITIKRETCCN